MLEVYLALATAKLKNELQILQYFNFFSENPLKPGVLN